MGEDGTVGSALSSVRKEFFYAVRCHSSLVLSIRYLMKAAKRCIVVLKLEPLHENFHELWCLTPPFKVFDEEIVQHTFESHLSEDVYDVHVRCIP